jgi:hypothetical protein
MGKKIAPATKNPHIACAKQVKMCVSHAIKHINPINDAQFMFAPYSSTILSTCTLVGSVVSTIHPLL